MTYDDTVNNFDKYMKMKEEIREELKKTPGMRIQMFNYYTREAYDHLFWSFFAYAPAIMAWATVLLVVGDPSGAASDLKQMQLPSWDNSGGFLMSVWLGLGTLCTSLSYLLGSFQGRKLSPLDRATQHVFNIRRVQG
jgi:hypothetical protein